MYECYKNKSSELSKYKNMFIKLKYYLYLNKHYY